MSLQNVGKTVVGVGLAAPAFVTNEHIAAFALFVACLGGTYASFAWGDPVAPRSKFFRLFVSCVIMGLAFSIVTTVVVEWYFDTLELTVAARCGIGAIVSCLTRFIMPKVIGAISDGTWKELIPFYGRKQ